MKNSLPTNGMIFKKLLEEHGSGYRVALHVGVTPQAVYERMHRLGIRPAGVTRVPGEPMGLKEKRVWLLKLLKGCTIKQVANKIHRSPSAVRERMKSCGIRLRKEVLPEILKTPGQKKAWYRGLIREHGSAYKLAQHLKISPQALYERLKRIGY